MTCGMKIKKGIRGLVAVIAAAGIVLPAAVTTATTASAAETPVMVTDPASYVNTLSGTGSGGGTVGSINNFPGPAVPFGMVQFSPDNPGTGQGYAYSNTTLRGFGLNHASQGCGAFGDIPILPTTKGVAAADSPWNTTNSYSHTGEVGEAGYYKLVSKDANNTVITSELSATTRTGVATFTFPSDAASPKVFVRSSVNNQGTTKAGSININPNTGIVTGWSRSGNFCGKNNAYQVYFAMKFETAFNGYGVWNEGTSTVTVGNGTDDAEVTNARAGGYVTFPAGTTAVRLKVALSYVSTDNAIDNMNTEVPTLDPTTLDTVRAATRNQWNDALAKATVAKSTAADLTTFYDSLYRSLLHPNTFSDANGQYIGFETTPKVHTVGETTGDHPYPAQEVQYANFSDWDTYRTLAPLLAMLYTKQASDQAQSLVNDAVQSGSFPRWAFANASTNQMTGDNAAALIAQTYAFGARDFDASTALRYMVKGASASSYTGGTNTAAVQRPGADLYNELHYAPQTRQFQADHAVAGASITQEWSIDDFGIGRLARSLGETEVAATFQERSNYWQNLFNPTTSLISPRDVNGTFPSGDGFNIPTDFGYRGHTDGFGQVGYDEGNAEQYLWLVPQNVKGLVTALGGREAVAERLDAFMTHGLNVGPGPDQPYMWAGNEPNFQTPWLYNYVGQPWRTQEVVDDIRTTLFGPRPDNSEPGNDDLGAQSSWYVWAALGIFPTTPATDLLTVNTPTFEKSRLTLGNGKTLTIDAAGATTGNRYISGLEYAKPGASSATELDQTYLPDGVLDDGGTLSFTTSATPAVKWATSEAAAPPSFGEGSRGVAANATPASVKMAPGEGTTLQLATQRIGTTSRSFTLSARSPHPGITADAPSGPQSFGTTGGKKVAVEVSVAASVPAGYYEVELEVTAGSSKATTATTITVTKPGSLMAAATVVGTSPQAAPSGNFDAAGNSYAREQLAKLGLSAGKLKALDNGTTIVWPSAPVGQPDTIETSTAPRLITLDRPASTISFIGAGLNGGGQNTAIVTLDNGATGTADYSFGDWVLPSKSGSRDDGTLAPVWDNTAVGWTPVRNANSSDPGAYVFATKPYTAPEGTHVVSVTLPKTNLARIFTIAQNAPRVAGASGRVEAGHEIAVAGTGFGPGEKVTFTIAASKVGTATADVHGIVEAIITVPASTPAGSVTVTATGEASPITATFSLDVTPRTYAPRLSAATTVAARQPLAFTGSGFAPGESVTVTFGTQTARVTAGTSGEIEGSITAPSTPGAAEIAAIGETSRTPVRQTVTVTSASTAPTSTTVTLEVTPGHAVYAQPVSLKAAVTAGASGTVAFFDGSRSLGSSPVAGGAANLSVTSLSAGTHHLTARYLGDATHTASVSPSATVKIAKATTAKVTVTGKSFARNSKPTVTVTVQMLDNGAAPVGKVTVYVKKKAVKTVTLKASKAGRVTLTLPKRYSHSISVKAKFLPGDSKNIASKTSATVKIRVKK